MGCGFFWCVDNFSSSKLDVNVSLKSSQRQHNMTTQQEEKITDLIRKYNDILLISMRLAVAEDFLNLLILNRDDQEFELNDLLDNKEALTNHIMKQFLKFNSSPILEELRTQEFQTPNFSRRADKDSE